MRMATTMTDETSRRQTSARQREDEDDDDDHDERSTREEHTRGGLRASVLPSLDRRLDSARVSMGQSRLASAAMAHL